MHLALSSNRDGSSSTLYPCIQYFMMRTRPMAQTSCTSTDETTTSRSFQKESRAARATIRKKRVRSQRKRRRRKVKRKMIRNLKKIKILIKTWTTLCFWNHPHHRQRSPLKPIRKRNKNLKYSFKTLRIQMKIRLKPA